MSSIKCHNPTRALARRLSAYYFCDASLALNDDAALTHDSAAAAAPRTNSEMLKYCTVIYSLSLSSQCGIAYHLSSERKRWLKGEGKRGHQRRDVSGGYVTKRRHNSCACLASQRLSLTRQCQCARPGPVVCLPAARLWSAAALLLLGCGVRKMRMKMRWSC